MSHVKLPIHSLIEAAVDAAEASKDANYINTVVKPDRSAVVLTTVIQGKPLSWITYDPEQLDELIRQLQMFRADLR